MSRQAWAYVWSVILVGALLGVAALLAPLGEQPRSLAFVVLATLATLSQLFKALFKSRQQSDAGTTTYSPTLVFLFAGVLLLPPALFTLLVIIPHLIDWAKERLTRSANLPAWYIQPYNIATHLISGLAAVIVYRSLTGPDMYEIGYLVHIRGLALSPVIAAMASAVTYMLLNHLLVGQALVLARKVSWRETGTLEVENLLSDFIMLSLGFAVAMLWPIDGWLILPALAPLVLIYRALKVPQLKKDAQTDSKTGLLNSRHFEKLVKTELERAERFARPVALILADLDLLRNINNTYGHIAGDVVLAEIGKIIRETIRNYDIAARFGGEEFAIALPEVGPVEAQTLAERLRQAVETARFEVETSPTPISATLSLGVACFPGDGATLAALIHEADVAVYQAKLQGRNRVVFAADVPHFVKLQNTGEAAPDPQYAAAFTSRAGDGLRATGDGEDLRAEGRGQRAEETGNGLRVTGYERDDVQGSELEASFPAPGSQRPAPAAVARSPLLLRLYVGAVVAMGIGVGLLGVFMAGGWPDWAGLALLVVLAASVELLQINVYGGNTVSVSVAFAFSAALIAGMPGVIAVSGAIALAHYFRTHPPLHRTAFNWSTHLLAGTAVTLVHTLAMLPLSVANMLLLAVPVLLASLAYYAIDTLLIAGAISLSGSESLLSIWKRQFRWLAAHYLVLCVMGFFLAVAYVALGAVSIVVFALPVLMMRYAQQQYVEQTRKSVQELRRMNEQLAEANREVIGAGHTIRQYNDDLFLTLAGILDARDPFVSGHATQVARYATALAVEAGLPPERVVLVRQAALLHDIGKIAIPEQILHKTTRLTEEEFEEIKTHSAKGADILLMSNALRHLAPFVRHHHEQWDGKGYPDRLKGEEIPMEARILLICDGVEWMASERPFRRQLSLQEIVVELRACAGNRYDPALAEKFAQMIEAEGTRLIANAARATAAPSSQFRVPSSENLVLSAEC